MTDERRAAVVDRIQNALANIHDPSEWSAVVDELAVFAPLEVLEKVALRLERNPESRD